MKSTSFYKIGLILMLIINGLLIFLLVTKRPTPPPHPARQVELKQKISHELQLTPEQQEAYFELAKQHRQAVNKIENQQKQLTKSYFNHLKESTPDLTEKENPLDTIKELSARKVALTYNHFAELKSLCTEEQRARFERIMDEVIQVLLGNEKNLPPPPRDS